jgi:hypothetical protein
VRCLTATKTPVSSSPASAIAVDNPPNSSVS